MQEPTITTTLSQWNQMQGVAAAATAMYKELEKAGKIKKPETATTEGSTETATTAKTEVIWDDETKTIIEKYMQ